jgi:signal transduction histidine kinase
VKTLIAFAAIVVAASSLLVYLVVARALRPATEVLAGIERLEQGDLQSRLRSFGPIEFQRIGVGFNRMASALEAMTRERSELTARLVSAGEAERRRLARELHDELGQCITAVNAIASGVTQVAEERCPELVAEGERLARTGSHMMDMLRGMLRRLRPVAIEELGFAECIRALVAEFRCAGTQVELSVAEGVDDLHDDIVLSGYRVVQECLTNVARHARASSVAIEIATARTGTGDERSDLVIRVEDDGIAGAAGKRLQPGMGLLGMRERVAAIGGRLEFATKTPHGFSVVAHLPMTGGLAST